MAGIRNNRESGALEMLDPVFTDPETRADIKRGVLNGFSVGAIAARSRCSVCGGDYTKCDHVAGDEYENGHCVVFIEESVPAEFSVVQDPINLATRIP